MDRFSHALGMIVGTQLKEAGVRHLEADDFARAVKEAVAQALPGEKLTEAQQLVSRHLTEEKERAAREAQAVGEAFLKENAHKDGVCILPSGLQYTILREGTGRKPMATDRVRCHYEGKLVDGTIFDSSYKRGEPATFPLGGVIKGWTEGLQLMAEGAKFRFFIPPRLAYGANGAGSAIPPHATLVFDVELIAVE